MRRIVFYIIFLLMVFTGAMTTSALWTYNLSLQAARGNLKTAATNMAINLDFTLNHMGLQKDYFQKLVASGEWEAVAFLALYGKEGVLLLHSNPHLIGKRGQDSYVERVLRMGPPSEHTMTLKTGEDVYVLDFPAHLRKDQGLEMAVLRVALHTYPSMGVVRKARLHLTLSLGGVGVLWILSFLLFFYMSRSYRMEHELMEQKRLALLGEMAAVLAHEIRNPLGSIKGFAQFLMEKRKEQDPEKEYLQTMVEECRRLEKLVRDLLSYARQEDLSPTSFSLTGLIQECIHQTEETSKGEKIPIQWESPGEIVLYADRDKFKQVLLNLLQNAIEAQEPGGSITLEASQENGKMVLWIKDRGKGMDQETLKKIFQPFFTSKSKGTGLGLAIVKKLVEQMGGELYVNSQLGKGTSVQIILPIQEKGQGESKSHHLQP
jgi:two-component system sensor histidine kinase HydH